MSDFTDLPDLASERLGGAVLAANDDFFAPKENLILESEPVWKEGVYTDRGKWMDGWETRRRREPGHDWCLIRLGLPGVVRGVVADTRHFRGNYPESCAIAGAALETDPPAEVGEGDPRFRELLPRTALEGDRRNAFAIADSPRVTHLVLRIYPDGGVARLRVYGEVAPDWSGLAAGAELDLAAIEHGGRVVDASDRFFGPPHRLIYPGPSRGMSDGWETRRRRGPGHDWVVVALGAPGRIARVLVDTAHFKGNAPGWCSLEASASPLYSSVGMVWRELVAREPLRPDSEHLFFPEPGQANGAHATRFVRLNIFPDGGVARLRLFGTLAESAR